MPLMSFVSSNALDEAIPCPPGLAEERGLVVATVGTG